MTSDTLDSQPLSTKRRRWTRAAGWALIALGVVVSWVWSIELTILGASAYASLAGVATLLLFCAGIALIWRVSPHRGRISTVAFRVAVIGTAVGAIVAGIVPVAVTSANTGTVAAKITSGTLGGGYRISGEALVSSDEYHQTTLDLTVSATDLTTPQLVATVSFTDGTPDVTCANTRQTWTHDVSTVMLHCDSFTPISALETVSGVAVTEK